MASWAVAFWIVSRVIILIIPVRRRTNRLHRTRRSCVLLGRLWHHSHHRIGFTHPLTGAQCCVVCPDRRMQQGVSSRSLARAEQRPLRFFVFESRVVAGLSFILLGCLPGALLMFPAVHFQHLFERLCFFDYLANRVEVVPSRAEPCAAANDAEPRPVWVGFGMASSLRSFVLLRLHFFPLVFHPAFALRRATADRCLALSPAQRSLPPRLWASVGTGTWALHIGHVMVIQSTRSTDAILNSRASRNQRHRAHAAANCSARHWHRASTRIITGTEPGPPIVT